MCSRILAAIFVIYCFNSGFCEENSHLVELPCRNNLDCEHLKETNLNATCVDNNCICTDDKLEDVQCIISNAKMMNLIGGQCPCKTENSVCNNKTNLCECVVKYTATNDKKRCIEESVKPGNKCEENKQCIMKDKNAFCDQRDHFCKCSINYISKEGHCFSIFGLEHNCTQDEQCKSKTENSICVKELCTCKKGFVVNREKTACLKDANLGERCSEAAQCRHLGEGGMCSNENICECDNKHYKQVLKENESFCDKIIEEGSPCRHSNECTPHFGHFIDQPMQCLGGKCNCPNGFVAKDNGCFKNNIDRSGSSSPYQTASFILLPLIGISFILI